MRGRAWYDEAATALVSIQKGQATEADWAAITPFSYGRWDLPVDNNPDQFRELVTLDG